MMDVQLSKIVLSKDSLDALFKQKMDIKVAFKIAKLISVLNNEAKIFQDSLDKLKNDLEIKNDDFQNPKKDILPKIREFNLNAEELADSTIVSIPIDSKIQLKDLPGVELTPLNIAALDWLLDE